MNICTYEYVYVHMNIHTYIHKFPPPPGLEGSTFLPSKKHEYISIGFIFTSPVLLSGSQ